MLRVRVYFVKSKGRKLNPSSTPLQKVSVGSMILSTDPPLSNNCRERANSILYIAAEHHQSVTARVRCLETKFEVATASSTTASNAGVHVTKSSQIDCDLLCTKYERYRSPLLSKKPRLY
jgi:hypothetical protein